MSNNGSNTSNAGGPTSMSNASRGTRIVSAGDWVRMKRLLGARSSGYSYTSGMTTYNGLLTPTSPIFNKDVAPTTSLQIPYGLPIHSFPVVGTSKYRRTASNWIDNVAFRNADIVLSSQVSVDNAGNIISALKLCSCTKTNLANKDVVCRSCSTRKPQGQQQETNMDGGGGGRQPDVVVDWQSQDANNGSETPLCYAETVGRVSLPVIFDPCLGEGESLSFSFSNLLNIGNVSNIFLYAGNSVPGTYDFSLFTLSDVSISGGGTIISVTGSLSSLEIRVSGLTSSSVITITIPDGDRQGLCSLDNICIGSILPVAPVASFDADPRSGTAPLTVNFTDTSSNLPTSWSWDFGDGSPLSSAQNPTHIYTSAVGSPFTVTLTATNSVGSDIFTAEDLINVTGPPSPLSPYALALDGGATDGTAVTSYTFTGLPGDFASSSPLNVTISNLTNLQNASTLTLGSSTYDFTGTTTGSLSVTGGGSASVNSAGLYSLSLSLSKILTSSTISIPTPSGISNINSGTITFNPTNTGFYSMYSAVNGTGDSVTATVQSPYVPLTGMKTNLTLTNIPTTSGASPIQYVRGIQVYYTGGTNTLADYVTGSASIGGVTKPCTVTASNGGGGTTLLEFVFTTREGPLAASPPAPLSARALTNFNFKLNVFGGGANIPVIILLLSQNP